MIEPTDDDYDRAAADLRNDSDAQPEDTRAREMQLQMLAGEYAHEREEREQEEREQEEREQEDSEDTE